MGQRPWPLGQRAPLCRVGSLAFALAMAAACSGKRASEAPAEGASLTEDGAYGGSFPAAAPPGDDGDSGPSDPPLDAAAVDDDEAGDGADVSIEETTDPLPDGACLQPLAPGDLRIDELMIESVAGAGDDGEWLEIESTLDCSANLSGLHGECPRGAKVSTFDVTGDLWIPPRGTFVVADSADPAINHDVPGVIVVWFGHAGDILRNKGSTITVSSGGTLIDTVTYPALTLVVGDSVAFPSNCDAGERSDFAQWKRSTATWFPGFLGTPNAPNADVACP
jgi:hypothetical protein